MWVKDGVVVVLGVALAVRGEAKGEMQSRASITLDDVLSTGYV